MVACAAAAAGACGGQTTAPAEDPADYPYATLGEARSAISSFAGAGCLQLRSYVGCASRSQAECPPRYRLDEIALGAAVGPCGESTFVGVDVRRPDGSPLTWTCLGADAWSEPSTHLKGAGALVCRP